MMACPVNSRVYFPAGIYRITSLFLKSHIRIELAEGAELKAFTDREKFPTFPGMLQSYDETDEYNLGTWEGILYLCSPASSVVSVQRMW